jgi:hypothetical protein
MHVAFVAMILISALIAGDVFARLGVLSVALAYALFWHSRSRHEVSSCEVSIGDRGVRQIVGREVEEAAWEDLRSYVTTSMELRGIGLRGEDGKVRLVAGRWLESSGPVTVMYWRVIARGIRARLSFDRIALDEAWKRMAFGEATKFVGYFVGIGLCLAPSLLRVAQAGAKDGGSPSILLAQMSVLLLLGGGLLVARLLADNGADASEAFAAGRSVSEENVLLDFLEGRGYRLDPVEIEVGQTYRYVEPNKLFARLGSWSDERPGQIAEIALINSAMLIRNDGLFTILVVYLLAGRIPSFLRWRTLQALKQGRDAEFSFDEGDLVVRRAEHEERYPVASARRMSVGSSWFEVGGEVDEYRNGKGRILLDRRFLLPTPR